MGDLLRVRNLRVSFGEAEVLKGLDLHLAGGEALALTGPSGVGKSVTARALLGLLPVSASWGGSILWKGQPLTDPAGSTWRRVRGAGMTLVLQEPMAALDPVMTVGEQIAETVRFHQGLPAGPARLAAVELLDEMMVPDPDRVAALHPHRLSGGQRQRALIAAALACNPELLVADEPTTALDVLVQKGILEALDRARRQRDMGLLFISHDRDLVSLLADRVVELNDGRAGEPPTRDQGAGLAGTRNRSDGAVVLEARDLVVGYDRGPAVVKGVDLALQAGECLGLVGQSGCGKTTLARALAGHRVPSGGSISIEGRDLVRQHFTRRQRRRVQLLFQDPGSSLNPRMRVRDAVAEALDGISPGPPDHVEGLFNEVGLGPQAMAAFPHELSGGQRQRVALARCLAADPAVLIADEPTSALDDRTRDRILNLLAGVRERRGLALMMISHDLPMLEKSCDRIAVLLAGVVVEVYRVGEARPSHPYTRELWAASPATLQGQQSLWESEGLSSTSSRDAKPGGCPHSGSCSLRKEHCDNSLPPLVDIGGGHFVRCPEREGGPPSQFIDT